MPSELNFSIRPGVPPDARGLYELDSLCFPPTVAFSLDIFRYHLEDRHSINLVAELSGAPDDSPVIGFIIGHIRRKSGQIVTMDVHPEYRGRGVGGRLLDDCEKRMIETGARDSELQVAVDNDPAIALYTKAGYKALGRIPRYYPHPFPRGTDAILMMKRF
jgi:ribosomal-protein-alanine N-acetyltransferase